MEEHLGIGVRRYVCDRGGGYKANGISRIASSLALYRVAVVVVEGLVALVLAAIQNSSEET